MAKTFSKGPLRRTGHRDAYRELLERMGHTGAGRVNSGKYKDLTWNDVHQAAEKLDDQRVTGRYSAAIFDRIFALTLERSRQMHEVKAKLVGRVLFVKSTSVAARRTARNPGLTEEQLRSIARRLALL